MENTLKFTKIIENIVKYSKLEKMWQKQNGILIKTALQPKLEYNDTLNSFHLIERRRCIYADTVCTLQPS